VDRWIQRSTVGSDTPANAAVSLRRRPSARHNTIRARVAIVAGLSASFEHGEVRLGVAAVESAFDQRRNLRSRAGLAFLAAAVKLRLDGAMNAVQLRDPVFDRFAIVVVARHLGESALVVGECLVREAPFLQELKL
jgi:hypothetical protein